MLCTKSLVYASNLPAHFSHYATDTTKECTYTIRKAKMTDEENLKTLYKDVAQTPGGLARTVEEITDDYIHKSLFNGVHTGLALIVEHDGIIIGSMIKYRLEPKVFSHVLTEGSILVHSHFQGKGIGTRLVSTFLKEITDHYPSITRIEIIARESNPAIKGVYEKCGFVKEGRFEGRICGITGNFEADIPMAWTRK